MQRAGRVCRAGARCASKLAGTVERSAWLVRNTVCSGTRGNQAASGRRTSGSGLLVYRFALPQAECCLRSLQTPRMIICRDSLSTSVAFLESTPSVVWRIRSVFALYPYQGYKRCCWCIKADTRHTTERTKRPVHPKGSISNGTWPWMHHRGGFPQSHCPSRNLGSMVHGNEFCDRSKITPALLLSMHGRVRAACIRTACHM